MITSSTKSFVFLTLQTSIAFRFLSSSKKPEHDLIFIRHAESQFNTACEQYRQHHNIPYIWKELCNHQGFDQKILYNTRFIDCHITSHGRADVILILIQCISKRVLLKNQKIDCVLVSPQIRALQTCSELFKGKQVPIIVEPLLIGPLRSCSDISKSFEYKKLIFPQFNFSPTKKYQQLWYLDFLSPAQKKICENSFHNKKLETVQQKRQELLLLLKQGKVYEDAFQFRKRIEDLKQRIAYYKSIFNRIAIVSHYYTIEYMGAEKYMKNGSPNFNLDVQNCTPYYASTQKLLQSKNG